MVLREVRARRLTDTGSVLRGLDGLDVVEEDSQLPAEDPSPAVDVVDRCRRLPFGIAGIDVVRAEGGKDLLRVFLRDDTHIDVIRVPSAAAHRDGTARRTRGTTFGLCPGRAAARRHVAARLCR
jgi:hypothetical protein